jgi:hypothetical protein
MKIYSRSSLVEVKGSSSSQRIIRLIKTRISDCNTFKQDTAVLHVCINPINKAQYDDLSVDK